MRVHDIQLIKFRCGRHDVIFARSPICEDALTASSLNDTLIGSAEKMRTTQISPCK